MGKTIINIPHHYTPREYQLPLLEAFDNGIKRGVLVWHRRSGKDTSCLNLCVQKMFDRVGSYIHFFPTSKQGRMIMWDGYNKDGFRFIDHIPREVIAGKNEVEMKITLTNGSYYQVVGTDKRLDWIPGINPVGVIFSEFTLMNPLAWDLIRPVLRENGGWALFNFTPRGENHGYQLYEMAKDNPNWFCSLMTVNDTQRPDGSPVITGADIEEERREGMSEAMIEQEYFCSFQGVAPGAYFAKEMKQAETGNRITTVPWESGYEVDTWWDLGMNDSTSIWFTQSVGTSVRCIDYYENSGEGLPHYANVLKEKEYSYGSHHLPHDVEVRELGSGSTRRETAENLGVRPIQVGKRVQSKEDSIEAARQFINKCWFDKDKCKQGIAALRNYRKDYDSKNMVFRIRPVHDWASHGADAFMELAMNHAVYDSTWDAPMDSSYIDDLIV